MRNEVNKEYTLGSVLKPEADFKEPALYRVILHNDDYTPMEFVAYLLEHFFYMTRIEAINVMMEAHLKGKASCGLYTRDIAESKIALVISCAVEKEYPLLCSMEAALS